MSLQVWGAAGTGPGQEDHLRFAYPNLGDDAVAGLAERLAILGGAR